jgi:hypothetical protein
MIVGRGGQNIAAILSGPQEPVEPVIFVGKEASVGMGDARAVAVAVMEG